MALFPTDHAVGRTKLSKAQILQRLKDDVDAVKILRFSHLWKTPEKRYEGAIHESSFKIMRIISYRNPFLPVIRGKIQNENGGCRIEVRTSISWFVLGFLAIWCSGMFLGFIAVLWQIIQTRHFSWTLFFPLSLLGFFIGLVHLCFKPESYRAISELGLMLETEFHKTW